MKLLNAPRQPFIGLVAAAATGIIFAEFFRLSPYVLLATAILVAFCGVIVLRWPRLAATYAIVGAGFFLLHGLRTNNTEGQQLAEERSEERRVGKECRS